MIRDMKPCPMCGCKEIDVSARKTIIVECKGCGLFLLNYQDGEKRDVIAAWNRRVGEAEMTTREEFEAWAEDKFPIATDSAGSYRSAMTYGAWMGWQASRTAALEEAAKECDLMQKHFDTRDAIDAAEQCAMGIRALKGE